MQKPTTRQLRALKTKRKIHKAAVDLFNQNGFDNTKISDVIKKAGVSVGAFYHYYSSKADIYSEFYNEMDEFYKNIVKEQLDSDNSFENIIFFFKQYANYISEKGTDSVRQLFNTRNLIFLDENRYINKLLFEIIKIGKEQDSLTNAMTAEEIKEFLMVVSRGIVYDWLLHEGNYELTSKMEKYILNLIECCKFPV